MDGVERAQSSRAGFGVLPGGGGEVDESKAEKATTGILKQLYSCLY